MTTLDCQTARVWKAVPPPEPEATVSPPPQEPPALPTVRDYLDCGFTQTLEAHYGARWEKMSKYSKLTFRAVLSLYVFWSQWIAAAEPEALMAEALEQVNSDLRLEDPAAYAAIANCIQLALPDLEGLLQALSEQIAIGCWSNTSN